jgi:hypothetical protein
MESLRMVTAKVPVPAPRPGKVPGGGELGQKVASIWAAMFWPATLVAPESSVVF